MGRKYSVGCACPPTGLYRGDSQREAVYPFRLKHNSFTIEDTELYEGKI